VAEDLGAVRRVARDAEHEEEQAEAGTAAVARVLGDLRQPGAEVAGGADVAERDGGGVVRLACAARRSGDVGGIGLPGADGIRRRPAAAPECAQPEHGGQVGGPGGPAPARATLVDRGQAGAVAVRAAAAPAAGDVDARAPEQRGVLVVRMALMPVGRAVRAGLAGVERAAAVAPRVPQHLGDQRGVGEQVPDAEQDCGGDEAGADGAEQVRGVADEPDEQEGQGQAGGGGGAVVLVELGDLGGGRQMLGPLR